MALWEQRAIRAGHELRGLIATVLRNNESICSISIADVVLALVADPACAPIPNLLSAIARGSRLAACNGFIACSDLLLCDCAHCSQACRKHTSAVVLVALGRQIDIGTECHKRMHVCKRVYIKSLSHMRRNANMLRTYKKTLDGNIHA